MADGDTGKLLIAAGATVDPDLLATFKKLRRRAMRLGLPIEDAEDAAQQTILKCLEAGIRDRRYHHVAMRRYIRRWRARRRARNEDYIWTYVDEFDEPVEMQRLLTQPNQEQCVELALTKAAIAQLPALDRDVVWLAASGEEHGAIAEAFCVSEKHVKDRLNRVRRKLRQDTGRDFVVSQTSCYRGVVRHHKKWAAYFNNRASRKYLGLYQTAAEAAHAYDSYARSVGRKEVELNFPTNDEAATSSGPQSMPSAKLDHTRANEIRRRLIAGASTASLALEYSVSVDTIRKIRAGKIWRER